MNNYLKENMLTKYEIYKKNDQVNRYIFNSRRLQAWKKNSTKEEKGHKVYYLKINKLKVMKSWKHSISLIKNAKNRLICSKIVHVYKKKRIKLPRFCKKKQLINTKTSLSLKSRSAFLTKKRISNLK